MDEFMEKIIKKDNNNYTKSAYTQARAKISPSLFVMLNEEMIKEYYEDENRIKLFKGLRILAIDGSTLQLPNVEPIEHIKQNDETQNNKQQISNNIRTIYGYNSNNKGEFETKARISILEDVENNMVLHGVLGSYYNSEKDMAFEHIEYLTQLKKQSPKYKDLIVFDRGYPSFALLLYLKENNIDYIIRMPRNRFKEIDNFKNDKRFTDKIIELELTKNRIYDMKRKNNNPKISQTLENKDIGDTIKVRAIKVKLKNGEIEILITSLLDKKEYKTKIFKDFYFKRWGVEEEYKAIKSLLQVENFTGITQIAINQDFFATILLLNINNSIINDVEESKIEDYNKEKERKYQYKINRSYTIGVFKERFIDLIINDGDIEEFFSYVEEKITKNLVPYKLNRSFDRKRKCRHKYPIGQKSVV